MIAKSIIDKLLNLASPLANECNNDNIGICLTRNRPEKG
jgi:hypothetical protein